MASSQQPVTFVLPGDGRSGGVRVTVLMANLLRRRGYPVRIACRSKRKGLRARFNRYLDRLRGTSKHDGFLHQFEGEILPFTRLDDLTYREREIVIAVGTYTVPDVRALTKPVVKVRFNHGFPAKPDQEQEQAWRGKMPTITVSGTLVPELQRLTEGSVWGVVPNGIDPKDYFVEPGHERNGIGALYNRHPNKAPEDLVSVLRLAHERWPTVPQHVFSTERVPTGLEHTRFSRLPSVAEARAIYNRSRVWVLTSLTEGLPGVVLEAMACGAVVVSSDNDGSLELIRHGENGLIAPRRDCGRFVAEIERVLTDDQLRQRLADAAMRTANEFTWDRAADRMENFLRDAPGLAAKLDS